MKSSKQQILEAAYQNETDYWVAPSQGFVADWFIRYWEMHNLILEHFGEERFDTPLIERKKYMEEKKRNGM